MCDEREKLIAYVYDDCDGHERREIEQHLTSCEVCRAEISGLRRVRQDLLAWDVPEHGSVWRPFVPPRVAPSWREVPAWAMAAAASLLLAAGAAGGLATHALLPHQPAAAVASVQPASFEAAPAAAPVRIGAADLSALEQRVLATLRAEIDERARIAAAGVPTRAIRESVIPEQLTSEVSALRAEQFDTLRAVNADLRMLNNRTGNLEKNNLILTSLVAQQVGPAVFPAGQ